MGAIEADQREDSSTRTITWGRPPRRQGGWAKFIVYSWRSKNALDIADAEEKSIYDISFIGKQAGVSSRHLNILGLLKAAHIGNSIMKILKDFEPLIMSTSWSQRSAAKRWKVRHYYMPEERHFPYPRAAACSRYGVSGKYSGLILWIFRNELESSLKTRRRDRHPLIWGKVNLKTLQSPM